MPRITDPSFPLANALQLTDKVLGVVGGVAKNMTLTLLKSLVATTVEDSLVSDSATNAVSVHQVKLLNDALANKCPLIDNKVPSENLPSYVDDILEYSDLASFPTIGQKVKIYSALDTNLFYRWTGSTYVLIGDGTTVDVIGVGAVAFARYDIVQALTDADKNRFLANIGAKRTGNLITKTASYTLQLSDFQHAVDLYDLVYLRMNSAAATNITIDTTLSSLPNLAEINIRNVGTGLATLVATGTTLNGNLAFTAQYEVKTLVKVGANEWDVVGVLP